MHKSDNKVDPQSLLPSDLRGKWAVVPKFELYQVFASGSLFGAGVMASLLGATLGPKSLWYGFPLALVICFLQAKIFTRFADRLLRELGERQVEGNA